VTVGIAASLDAVIAVAEFNDPAEVAQLFK
jgi:hypothetical protein